MSIKLETTCFIINKREFLLYTLFEKNMNPQERKHFKLISLNISPQLTIHIQLANTEDFQFQLIKNQLQFHIHILPTN